MYTIYADGKPLYSPAMMGNEYRVLAPKLSLDTGGAGSASFTIPPGNRLYHNIRRRKSVITVHQDGREIFRGRVLDDTTDTYNQKDVYCEGVRGYLNDSQAAPYKYSGTVHGLFRKLIREHNDQVEAEKRFTVGTITAVDDGETVEDLENVAYWETYKEIDEKLLGAYGGYIRVRAEGDQLYIDWLKEYGSQSAQKIRFSINLLDIQDKKDAGEIFTILRPLGASEIGDDGEYSQPLTIESVNDGKDYIIDEDAVAQYGRIWKTYTWPNEDDPAKLLKKGRAFMKTGQELRTITLRAIDMRFLDGSVEAIHVGDKVHILSLPHGIDMEKVCCKIEIDLANPENTTYTFGEAPRTLTDNTAKAEKEIDSLTGYKSGGGRGGGGNAQKEMNGILRWAKVQVDETNGRINLNAGEVDSLKGRMSTAEIDIRGAYAQILLKASQEEVTDLGMRMSKAGIDIRGDIANIKLLATQEEVTDLGTELSEAWIEIDGLNSEIELKADRIDLKGYVTADEFSALESELAKVMAGTVQASHLYTQNLTATNTVRLKGHTCSWKSFTAVTDVSLSKSYTTVPGGNGADYVVIGGVSLSKDTDSIDYFGY